MAWCEIRLKQCNPKVRNEGQAVARFASVRKLIVADCVIPALRIIAMPP
jgi:hypothetical protein